jgi:hypothetical protein
MHAKARTVFILLLVTVGWISHPLAADDNQQTLFHFDATFDTTRVHVTDAQVRQYDKALEVHTGHAERWPGITLRAPAGKWDLSSYWYIAVELTNPTEIPVKVFCRIDNPRADGTDHCVTESMTLGSHEAATLIVRFQPTPWHLSKPLDLIGMRGHPEHLSKIDPAYVTQILLFVTAPKVDHRFRVSRIMAGGRRKTLDADRFIPFIDTFGQFVHDDWPGKTHSLGDLISQVELERADLAVHPGPENRNAYGGWTAGPRLHASGFFRVEKYQGKWWLVDPEGCLFWSHGIDCVHASTTTPISDREQYFAALPEPNSPLASFYGTGSWAPHGYYQSHTPYRTYDLCRANLLRKYGPDYARRFQDLTHRRLRSWGLNTIANWSDRETFLMRRTPYTDNLSFDAPVIEGSTGYWGKFYDVFDPAFRGNLRRRAQAVSRTSANDPWCIGYFVHNEIAWGDALSLSLATLASPPQQPAKKVMLADLKAKYRQIGKLNEIWQTDHQSWDDLLAYTDLPDPQRAHDDLAAFYDKIADTYFRTIQEELKQVAPQQLYLGCRFAWVNDPAARAAARYCDVVCYNKYTYSVSDLQLPEGLDKALIIGEFHFGALDRGLFHTGLKSTLSQQDRAQKYTHYVQGALRNPSIVGTHWFQYKDQATTGRGDGENYQIGFLDICDRPYPEIVKAAREIARDMYRHRLEP